MSGKIKLPDGMTRERSSKRLRHFADKLQEAIDPEQPPNATESAKSGAADAIRRGDQRDPQQPRDRSGGRGKNPRSYGDDAAAS